MKRCWYSVRVAVAIAGLIVAVPSLATSRARAAEPQQMAQAQTGASNPAAPVATPPVTPAQSAPKPGKSARLDKKACRVEIATLCSKTAGSRTKCLTANQAKLGPTCAAAVAATMQVREVAKAACVLDAQKLCGTARGAARTQCLEANKAQLSPECLARVEKKEIKDAAQKAAQPVKQ